MAECSSAVPCCEGRFARRSCCDPEWMSWSVSLPWPTGAVRTP